ncbi:MAG TPA: protein-disulfide reductase DsbD domain-containing protein [Chthoniobacterales bacterium]|nr:protein-disulfide reductase DsbD domain-containing protein [Chthoniobacterales bacterium]
MLSLRKFAGTLLVLGALLAAREARGQKFDGRQLVEAKLLADTTTVVPGQPFIAGLLLKMAPGWHTYWQFPGDAGIPTEIKWQLPPGWKAGAIQWPVPLKLKEPGDIQIYGYHDQVLLMVPLTPPPKIDAASVHLAAKADWLVCEKICIPGGAEVELDLPVGSQTAPADRDLFTKFQNQLPRALPPSAQNALEWTRGDKAFRLTIADKSLARAGAVDFFPLPESSTLIGHPQSVQSSDGSLVFTIPIESAPAGQQSLAGLIVAGAHAFSLGEATANSDGIAAVPPAAAGAPAPDGLLRLLFFGFLGGLILNLMPCVLPVISLKIFGFIKHAGDSRARIFGNGLAFTAGIFAWFIGLALLLIGFKSAGREITWAFQFTNPYFVVGMSAVVLVFALNLFGVFEITLPAAATTGLLGWSAREGYAGSFFQGVFATVLATPCTAPYLGTALGFAFAQSAGIILLMFVAIALGMSLPYLILSAQPAWLRFVPRPGPWMVRVKQFMGFLLLATLLFLLWVLGVARGIDAAIWASAFLLALSVACWMLGSFSTPGASRAQRSVVLVLILVLVLGSGFYFIGEKFRATKTATSSLTTDGWIPFSPERLQAELAAGHTVFLDFTAAWCITCKYNEAAVLESAAVKSAFARHKIVKMKADWTNADPVITKTLKQFGRVGVPLYVLYPAATPNQPVVLPELLTQALVLDHLESAAPKVANNQ